MEGPRDSGADGVSFDSTADTLDRNVEITPPTSPRPPRATADSRDIHGDLNVAPSPPSRSPAQFPQGSQLPPSTPLYRSFSVLPIVLIYATISILGWVVTCILTFRPLHAKRYGPDFSNENFNNYYGKTTLSNEILSSEKWIPAVRVLRAIAAVFTLPVASAVCASAAVVFVQRNAGKSRLNIRHVMVLADRAWADPASWGPAFLSWKRYGSAFLILTILLNILGIFIYPLQEGFLSYKTIKTPNSLQQILNVLDISDQFNRSGLDTSNLVVALTREALNTASGSTIPPNLWPSTGSFNSIFSSGTSGGDVFVAELPSGFNTGLVRQFLPRINSSAEYGTILESDFPTGCDIIPGAFYVKYSNSTGDAQCPGEWAVEACMPYNQTQTPWKSTHLRQRFSEELYLNFTATGCLASGYPYNYYLLTINTTAGYFELPNYMNGGVAGPLLDQDPNSVCGNDCAPEGAIMNPNTVNYTYMYKAKRDNSPVNGNATSDNNSTSSLESMPNKGPLLTIAMALFGHGSFPDQLLTAPEFFTSYLPEDALSCVEFVPMTGLVLEYEDSCITNSDIWNSEYGLENLAVSWISNFNQNSQSLTTAFTEAAILANQNWLIYNLAPYEDRSLTINYDLGTDTTIPSIPLGGLIATSVVIGLFFIILFALTAYSVWQPRWTTRLDAFTMMRMGAAMPDKLPMLVGRNQDKVKELDEIPGWVGDVAEDREPFGRLGLGADNMINKRKRYVCHQGDVEIMMPYERNELRKKYGVTAGITS